MNIFRLFSRNWWLIGLLAGATLAAACRIDEQDIQAWKGTVKGPGKLVAVMTSPRYSDELRVKAAQALVEMDRPDVEGVVELNAALRKIDPTERKKLIKGLTDYLAGVLEGGHDPDKEVTPAARVSQIRAKDAAYLIVSEASDEDRARLIDAVVGWYAADFSGRSLAGNYSAEQVIKRFGTEAARRFVDAMKAETPPQALVKASELVASIGDAEARQAGAQRLVAVYKTMQQPAFEAWLKARIKNQLASSKQKVSADKIKAATELNKLSFMVDGALAAMKPLAGEKAAQAKLREVAFTPHKNANELEARKQALRSLAGQTTEKDLEALFAIALDTKLKEDFRDLAFDRIGDVRSSATIERLWPVVTGADTPRVRWRAAELVLAIGGHQVVDTFFAKLPSDGAYPADELEVYATRMSEMSPQPTREVLRQLKSGSWAHRVIALRYLARAGTQKHRSAMKQLAGDGAKPKGPYWAKDATVGSLAADALEEMDARLKSPKDA